MNDSMELNRILLLLAWVSRMKAGAFNQDGERRKRQGLRREWRNEGKMCGQNYKFNFVTVYEEMFSKC